MRTVVIGGGPAGLYLAILLRKAGHAVTVLERNAPDATFGWGVVFSAGTLGALRDADVPTHQAITDSFARWSAVDIRFGGRLVRAGGNDFTAIARTRLLAILQERARDLGADLRFGVEVDTLPDADLVVAADGANSRFRDARRFGAAVRPEGGKYVWFGTDLPLDAFTFSFRETEHGLFQAHAYPFDEHRGTWIVECAEPVWRRAGLDGVTEAESIAFCERVFAEDLAGHALLSNRSRWLDFPRVSCKRWYDGNLVLIGDAAHTAHFSIGSGTKLAMEDAVALAAALERNGDLTAALAEYEGERQPVVERFQKAAGDSAAYFLRTARYTGYRPIQFAVNLLTRSGRVSHANLAARDPDLVRVADAAFAGAAPGAVVPPPVFTPLDLGAVRLPNRIVADASPGSAVDAVRAGAGLVAVAAAVSPEGRVCPETPVLDSPEPWTKLADAVHAAGGLLAVRLTHAGARGATRSPEWGADIPLPPDQAWPLVAASALPYGPFSAVPTELTDLDGLTARFVAAAGHAGDADVLELDLADGHLLAGFLSPLTNRRPETRAFPLAVLDAVRAAWAGPLIVRLCVDDLAPGGLTADDGVAVARQARERGADVVHVRAGHTVAESRPDYGPGHLTALSDRVRAEAGVRTLVGGYLTTADEANTVLAAGRADLCALSPRPTPLEELG
ncbi:FAD-dependent monooxygenase [Actinokineospora fastidiosa]|uniref:Salicylyl-CoA 5-hydroxylase n=1 Tax=Actinokineospora fastidiosa TaxID=1816 RepID=A0A918LJ74_9PSEU|nr:FAD-dependent monooxygenase [Actinokineospora fastidiosa]GGS59253.1 salicylyl-CoA 5-hydroxylase [Actinokineospora fastidiosa]